MRRLVEGLVGTRFAGAHAIKGKPSLRGSLFSATKAAFWPPSPSTSAEGAGDPRRNAPKFK